MARIADKHGLTNRYRPYGSKRVVKRGRPRKYLFGAPKRRRRSKSISYSASVADNNTRIIIVVIIGVIASIILPFLAPIFIGTFLVLFVDKILKQKWGLKQGKWSKPVSIMWVILSTFEMVFGMMAVFVLWIDKTASWFPLIISVVTYILLSVLILVSRYRRLSKNNTHHNET